MEINSYKVSGQIIIISLLLFLTFPAVKSLTLPGGFTSHDTTHHVVRQINMDKLLKEGQFPPRWSADLANGYGYPLFMFNYPLPTLIGQVFRFVGFNFLYSVKAVLFLSLVVSTLGMYFFLRALFSSSMASFLGAIFYLYNPIHLIVVYVSGSPGASMGLVFPPIICWSIVKLWQQKDIKFLLLGSISLAGLILSHNITALIFAPIILAFIITLKLLNDPKENKHFLQRTFFMTLLGLGIAAFFWMPAILEKQFIRYDRFLTGFQDDQFLSLKQMIHSPWGYGLSHPKNPEPGDMSYQIGLIHLLVMVILLPFLWIFRKKKQFLYIGLFVSLFFVTTIFLMMDASNIFWDKLPLFSSAQLYIQVPLRLLIVPTFCASIVAAMLIKYLPLKKVMFLGLLLLVFYANRNHLRINEKFDLGEGFYLDLAKKSTSTSFDEHLPIWVGRMRTDWDHGKFTFISGEGQVRLIDDKSAKVQAEIEATRSALIRFNQYYFPGWEIKVDGQKVNFDYQTTEEAGLPVFNIEKGKHQILAEFKNTPVRNLADFISVVFVILWLGLLCKLLMPNLLRIKRFF